MALVLVGGGLRLGILNDKWMDGCVDGIARYCLSIVVVWNE